jgi:putative endonuclease
MGLFDRFREEVRNTLFLLPQDKAGTSHPKTTTTAETRPRTAKQVAGQAGEDVALRFLLSQRMSLVERNFRCRGGEIDLIMSHAGTLVFVEVRKRGDRRFGGAAASITSHKQRRLILAGQVFLQRYRMPPACRFDVIAIDGARLDWLKDAIQA